MATKVPAWAKGYLTVKNAWIAGTALFIAVLVAMFFGGWSIRETKKELEPLQKENKDLKRDIKVLEQKRITDSIRLDSIGEAMERNNEQRGKQLIIYREATKKNVEKYNSPGFSNDDIRNQFRSN